MFNIFKPKTVEAPKKENQEALIQNDKFKKLEDSEPMDVRLEVISDYLKTCKDNGIEITPEMAEKELNEKLGLNISELLDEEIKDSEIKVVHKDVVTEIENMMNQKATEQGTVLNYLREKVFKSNYSKAAFVTAMLFLKFNQGHAATDSVKDKTHSNTEIKKAVNLDGGDGDKTYNAAEDFKNNDKKVTIKAGSFFETDKADIKNQSKLNIEFDNFFSSINDNNFDKMVAHNWIFSSSSDERKTANWGGSNKNLSDARFEEFKKAFEEAKLTHDFSGLSSDQIKQILDKPISNVQPANGETHITDLVNSETKRNFTQKEANALKSDVREKLLDQCRYANFEVESTMFEVGTFGQFILLVDDSPSMKISKANMADELKYINKDMPVKVGFFSSELSSLKQLNSSQEASAEILKESITGSGHELAISSAIQYLEKIPTDDVSSKIMYVATDEGLQDLDKILQLKELSKTTNTQVAFLMFHEKGTKFIKLSADDLVNKIKKNIESNTQSQEEFLTKNILACEQQITSLIKDINEKISNGSFEASNILADLGSDGIKGGHEQIKQALMQAGWQDLENLKKSYLGKKLVQAKINLIDNNNLLDYTHLPLEQRIAKTEGLAKEFGDRLQLNKFASLTSFEDSKGNKVEMPIY